MAKSFHDEFIFIWERGGCLPSQVYGHEKFLVNSLWLESCTLFCEVVIEMQEIETEGSPGHAEEKKKKDFSVFVLSVNICIPLCSIFYRRESMPKLEMVFF